MEQRNFEDHKTLGGKGRLTKLRMAEVTTRLVATPTSFKVHCVLSELGLITTCLIWVVLTVAVVSTGVNISPTFTSFRSQVTRKCHVSWTGNWTNNRPRSLLLDTGGTIDRGASYWISEEPSTRGASNWISEEPSTKAPPTPNEEDPKKVGLLNHR